MRLVKFGKSILVLLLLFMAVSVTFRATTMKPSQLSLKWVGATFMDSTVTSLTDINAAQSKACQRYNMMGQPVGNDYKGIVIEDGRKILVK